MVLAVLPITSALSAAEAFNNLTSKRDERMH